MILQESDFCNWEEGPLQETLKPGLSKLMSGLRYDSLSTYVHLFYDTDDDPLTVLQNTSLRGMIEKKGGQDCYDVLFELLASIPAELTPQIVGCPNTVHTTEAQLAAAPFLHVAMTITDPSSGIRYLLDPGKWITQPIELKTGTQVTADDGNVFTVTEATPESFVLDEYKILRDRHDTLVYMQAPKAFDLDANYVAYMRLRDRYNCITSVIQLGEPPYYLKYLCDTGSFSARLPDGTRVFTPDAIEKTCTEIDSVLGDSVAGRAVRFVKVVRSLPEGFWL